MKAKIYLGFILSSLFVLSCKKAEFGDPVILVTGTEVSPIVKFSVENTPAQFSVTATSTYKATEDINVTFEFDSAEDYVSFTQDIAAPVNMMLANETEENRAEIWNIVTDKVKSLYMKDNGRVVLDNECICVVANRQ